MTHLKVIDFQAEEKFQLTQEGEGNWNLWLAERGYELQEQPTDSDLSLELYADKEQGLYALYHPSFHSLDTEYLFVRIPNEQQAKELVSLAQQMLGMMNLIMSLKTSA